MLVATQNPAGEFDRGTSQRVFDSSDEEQTESFLTQDSYSLNQLGCATSSSQPTDPCSLFTQDEYHAEQDSLNSMLTQDEYQSEHASSSLLTQNEYHVDDSIENMVFHQEKDQDDTNSLDFIQLPSDYHREHDEHGTDPTHHPASSHDDSLSSVLVGEGHERQIEEADPTIKDVLERIEGLEKLLSDAKSGQESAPVQQESNIQDQQPLDPGLLVEISVLKHARSMSLISQHILFKDIFVIDHEHNTVKCTLCGLKSMEVQDTNFCASSNEKIPSWFSNFKASLLRHMKKNVHTNALIQDQETQERIRPIQDDICRYMRFLSYYIIKTNTAFQLFPTLIAVARRCDIITGDTNQSRNFVTDLTVLLEKVMLENTQNWLEAQDDRSVTLVTDIGTIFGLVISVVLFVGEGGKVRLAGCSLTISKTGSDLAQLVVDTVIDKAKVPLLTLKRVIGGVCADGVYCKGNEPFKSKFRDLLDNEELVFKWDLMHLMNRAHAKARGLTNAEKESARAIGEDSGESSVSGTVEEDDEGPYVVVDLTASQNKLLTRLLDYIQSQSKKWRTGLNYTKLVLESGNKFPRPKIMSSTRVSAYEFDQVFQFLKVKHYWDNPWEFEVLSQLYCSVLFALKIIMKMVQKTNVEGSYIERVFVKGEGKKSMVIALEAAIKLSKGECISYLKSRTDCEIIDARKPYVKDLHAFLKTNESILKPESLINTTVRTRGASAITFDTLVDVLRSFINSFWFQVDERLKCTELGKDFITYSEAPAESFFSEWKFITDHRPSLGFDMIVALIRIRTEGPGVGTQESHDLVRKALRLSKSHLGERFTTQNWHKGRVPLYVQNVLDKKWVWKQYSDLS